MFRIFDLTKGLWIKDFYTLPTEWTKDKTQAQVFPFRAIETFENDGDVEIVPLEEDELMSRTTGLTFEKPKQYNLRTGDMWVVAVGVPAGIQLSARQSEAKAFTEVPDWLIRRGFEAVEVGSPFGLEGKVDVLRLPGFE